MAGSIEFTPPYQDGWQDNEEGATPITADILNNNYDAFLLLLNTWIGNIEEELVAVPDFQISSPSSGQVLKYDGSKWVNAAESGGGSNVSWNQIVQTGTQIASITINGSTYNVYVPSSGSSVSINRKTTTGTNIADITIDGVTTQLFAPNGGSGGASSLNELSDVILANLANGQVLQYNSNTSKWENKSISVGDSVEFTQVLSSGVKIGTITIDGTDYDIYAPQGGGGGFEPNGDSYRIVSSKDGSDTVLNLEYYEDGSQSAVEMKMCEAGSSFTQDFHNLHLVSNGTTVLVSSKIDSIRFNNDIFNENDEIFSVTIGSATATYSDIEEGTYTPGGGSTVSWTQTQQSGTKIAEISIDGVPQNVYIPTPPAQVIANPSGTPTDELNTIQIGNDIYEIPQGGSGSASWKDVTGTLTAGQTSITLSSSYILTTSTLDFYTDKFGVSPTDAVVTNGSVTLTFEAQSTDLAVKVRITNDEIPAMPLIPKMTSNTLPSGKASASTEYNSSYYAYKAFDDNSSTLWGSHDNHSAGEWIKYDFGAGNEKKLDSFYFLNRSESNYAVGSFKFQGSNDDVNWTDLAEVTGADINDSATVPINSAYKNTAFRYVRWIIVSNAHGGSGTGFVGLQVNGWEE